MMSGAAREDTTVRVLVRDRGQTLARYEWFWAQFEGEEVSSYRDERGDRKVTYTLYKCTVYGYDAYRVHVADTSDPQDPTYALLPREAGRPITGSNGAFHEPYNMEDVANEYPLFAKDVGMASVFNVDP